MDDFGAPGGNIDVGDVFYFFIQAGLSFFGAAGILGGQIEGGEFPVFVGVNVAPVSAFFVKNGVTSLGGAEIPDADFF